MGEMAGTFDPAPAAALARRVATARERDMALPKGSIVSTGSVSKPFNFVA